MEELLWTQRDGEKIRFADMSTNYLANVVNYIRSHKYRFDAVIRQMLYASASNELNNRRYFSKP